MKEGLGLSKKKWAHYERGVKYERGVNAYVPAFSHAIKSTPRPSTPLPYFFSSSPKPQPQLRKEGRKARDEPYTPLDPFVYSKN